MIAVIVDAVNQCLERADRFNDSVERIAKALEQLSIDFARIAWKGLPLTSTEERHDPH